jgi:hypothetical protein
MVLNILTGPSAVQKFDVQVQGDGVDCKDLAQDQAEFNSAMNATISLPLSRLNVGRLRP